MIESYLAPSDLAEARRRIEAMVATRCREREVPVDGEHTVVRLTNGPIEPQLENIKPNTVCVVTDLVLWRAEQKTLDALAAALAQDRSLLFMEPTADLGWRSAVHRIGRPLWRLVLRHDFAADVPAELRDAGLVVTTTDRFGIGWRGLRSYAWGEASHFVNK